MFWPCDVYGPSGLTALINGYWESNRDNETRIADDGRVDLRRLSVPMPFTNAAIAGLHHFVKVMGPARELGERWEIGAVSSKYGDLAAELELECEALDHPARQD